MLTVALVSQKGGAGKTTIAINLAIASELAGRPAVIIDLDPQASSATWGDSREAEAPVVVSAQAARLAEVLATAREHGAALTLIDTPRTPKLPPSQPRAPSTWCSSPAAPPCSTFEPSPPRRTSPSSPAPRPPRCCVQSPRAVRSPARPKAPLEAYGLPVAPVRIGQRAAPSCTP